jgi:hypothetical protein
VGGATIASTATAAMSVSVIAHASPIPFASICDW